MRNELKALAQRWESLSEEDRRTNADAKLSDTYKAQVIRDRRQSVAASIRAKLADMNAAARIHAESAQQRLQDARQRLDKDTDWTRAGYISNLSATLAQSNQFDALEALRADLVARGDFSGMTGLRDAMPAVSALSQGPERLERFPGLAGSVKADYESLQPVSVREAAQAVEATELEARLLQMEASTFLAITPGVAEPTPPGGLMFIPEKVDFPAPIIIGG